MCRATYYPQWLEDDSAKRLLAFLDDLWEREDDEGLDDPARIHRSRDASRRMTRAPEFAEPLV